MNTTHRCALIIGKLTFLATRLRGGGGSAAPGLVVERLSPNFMQVLLAGLPKGVIVVTGTNGKTTTTKILSELLEAEGLRVLTNNTGSNFTRGVVAQIVKDMRWWDNRLPHDIAVLELDEAYGKHFVARVKPEYSVVLNILRDQLDRFGEMDYTLQLVTFVLQAATKGVIVNGDEPGLVEAVKNLDVPRHYYMVHDDLRALFPTDAELLSKQVPRLKSSLSPDGVQLIAIHGQTGSYRINNKTYEATLALRGRYNFQNAAAALATCLQIMPSVDPSRWITHLEAVRPAFGRGEVIDVAGTKVELVLVKNPAGFQQAVASYTDDARIMVAINDNYQDGRDVSWLWDVSFESWRKNQGITVSGTRAYDMALRLQYEEVAVDKVDVSFASGVQHILRTSEKTGCRIFCTYTSMLALRKYLATLTAVEFVL